MIRILINIRKPTANQQPTEPNKGRAKLIRKGEWTKVGIKIQRGNQQRRKTGGQAHVELELGSFALCLFARQPCHTIPCTSSQKVRFKPAPRPTRRPALHPLCFVCCAVSQRPNTPRQLVREPFMVYTQSKRTLNTDARQPGSLAAKPRLQPYKRHDPVSRRLYLFFSL